MKAFTVKDPASAGTHFLGILFTIIAAFPLIMKGADSSGVKGVIAFLIFMLSMGLLYTASTLYHTFDITPRINLALKKFDHLMIFLLIAGSYTPVCLLSLSRKSGNIMLAVIWGLAIIGIVLKSCWIFCPKWVSSLLYIGMGWVAAFTLPEIYATLPRGGFFWLLAGGIIYTIGGVIYALKCHEFNRRHPNFGTHEIFHLFVLGGSICHFILMYLYIA